MSKIFTGIALTLLIIISLTGGSEAGDVIQLNDLIENGKSFDGKKVAIQGEAIGEAMERKDYSWVNINDKTNALGIWMSSKDAEKIMYFGDYKHLGDTIQVTGTFHRACAEHGGDMDIHSATVDIVSRGNIVQEQIDSSKGLVAIGLTIVTLIISGIYLKITRA